MVAYSFQRRFETPIMEGTKRQTIRAVGKRRHARVGDELQLYVGLRTKSARILKRAICRHFGLVAINFDGPDVAVTIRGNATYISRRRELDDFARADGFPDWNELVRFWSQEHFNGKPPEGVFHGVIVKW